MATVLTGAPGRRGLYDGILIGIVVMAAVFVSNVVVPVADQDYPAKDAVSWATLGLLAVLFMLVGGHGQRQVGSAPTRDADAGTVAGIIAGAVAGCVVAVMLVATFLIMDNLFFAVVVQQPYKTGMTRAALNATALTSTLFFLPVGTLLGAMLGGVGGAIFENRARRTGADEQRA
jgi:hypothetical protein